MAPIQENEVALGKLVSDYRQCPTGPTVKVRKEAATKASC